MINWQVVDKWHMRNVTGRDAKGKTRLGLYSIMWTGHNPPRYRASHNKTFIGKTVSSLQSAKRQCEKHNERIQKRSAVQAA